MILPQLSQQLSQFFYGVSPQNTIVFTTFGLDEAALVRILRQDRIPSNQRIVVFHEIMKHRNPGLLQLHYPQSKVIAVQIVKKNQKNICPIFHSKIWMEISHSPFLCKKLVVTSANITRYHLDLDTDGKTCESFLLWEQLAVKLPKYKLFDKRLLFEGRGIHRIKIRPATVIVDDLSSKIEIIIKEIPVFNYISSFIGEKEEVFVGCAAPFVNKTPVKRLHKNNNNIKIWSGKKRDNTKLHLKLLELNKFIILGSPNITNQAYGISKHGVVNHEVISLSRKPRGFSANRTLKGFSRIDFNNLEDDDREPIEDTDGVFDWLQQKEWSVKGPDSVTLLLNDQTNRVEIILKGQMENISKLTIHNYRGDNASPALLASRPRKYLSFPRREQQQSLVEAVLSPPVLMKGLRGKRTVWVREINLGEFWGWIENNINFVRLLGLTHHIGDYFQKDLSTGRRLIFDDVRDLRLKAFLEKKLTSRVQMWHKWICRYSKRGVIGQSMPEWCIDLGKQLRKLHNA
jgi:hypothetical protein